MELLKEEKILLHFCVVQWDCDKLSFRTISEFECGWALKFLYIIDCEEEEAVPGSYSLNSCTFKVFFLVLLLFLYLVAGGCCLFF